MRPEIEAKLAAPGSAALARLPAIARECGFLTGEVERTIVHDHYLDSADLDLYRAGWALRVRDTGVRQRLTLKALTPPRDGLAIREEREEAIAWRADDGWEPAARGFGGEPRRLAGGKPLERLFTIQQLRAEFPLAGAAGTEWEGFWCLASMDHVRWSATDGSVREAFEAEFELRQGVEEQLRSCVRRIALASLWPPADTSKFQRGLEAAGLA
jgi:inorganic triphosphatase YgiF